MGLVLAKVTFKGKPQLRIYCDNRNTLTLLYTVELTHTQAELLKHSALEALNDILNEVTDCIADPEHKKLMLLVKGWKPY